jgi:hypothetical protein
VDSRAGDSDARPGRPSETARAHQVVRTHLPQRDWRWLGMRFRCRRCGMRFPCPPWRSALNQLEGGVLSRNERHALNQPDTTERGAHSREEPDFKRGAA